MLTTIAAALAFYARYVVKIIDQAVVLTLS